MSPFIRIKNYVINLESLAYIRVDQEYIEFGFSADEADNRNYIRFKKGTDLKEAEFEEVKEFAMQLPDPDRVIAV